MNKLTLEQIRAAVDAAFQTALPAPARSCYAIGTNAILRTDTYCGPKGKGFAVVAVVDLGWRKLVIARQHGPETWREQLAPTLDALVQECRELREKAYPPQADYLDAQVKQSSIDEAIAALGLAQEHAYKAACLAVKAKYPKPA